MNDARHARGNGNGRVRRFGRGAGMLGDDTGSGSVLAVAVIAAVLTCTALLFTMAVALGEKRALAGAADAAALAAADVASGLVAGYPCDVAGRAAELAGDILEDCEVLDSVATVTVSRTVAGIPLTMSARAGPPEPPATSDQAEGRARKSEPGPVPERRRVRTSARQNVGASERRRKSASRRV